MYERDWFKWFSCKGKTESVRWEGRRNFWLCRFEYFLDWVLHHNTSVFRFWGQLRFSVSFYFDFRFSDCYSVFFRFLFGKCALNRILVFSDFASGFNYEWNVFRSCAFPSFSLRVFAVSDMLQYPPLYCWRLQLCVVVQTSNLNFGRLYPRIPCFTN